MVAAFAHVLEMSVRVYSLFIHTDVRHRVEITHLKCQKHESHELVVLAAKTLFLLLFRCRPKSGRLSVQTLCVVVECLSRFSISSNTGEAMAHLKQKYEWIDEFQENSLTIPSPPNPFIEIHFDTSQVRICWHCICGCEDSEYFSLQNSHKLREHSQFRTKLPFACSQCFSAPIVDIQQLANNSADGIVKTVYELTLKVVVSSNICRTLNSCIRCYKRFPFIDVG